VYVFCSGKQIVTRDCTSTRYRYKPGTCLPYDNGIQCFCFKDKCNDKQFDSTVLKAYKALDSAPGDSPRNGSQPSDGSDKSGGSKSASTLMTMDVVIFISLVVSELL